MKNSKTKNLSPLIIALDQMNEHQINQFLFKYGDYFSTIKIGMELFFKYGKPFLSHLHEKFQVDIFLDLKLHDIPQTVAKAISSLSDLPVKFLTLHLAGGESMLLAAKESARVYLPQTQLLGVTYLTSLDHQDLAMLWGLNPADYQHNFQRLLHLAVKTKIPGIILSPQELAYTENFNLLKICPGIRFSDDLTQDQKRVMTPEEALQLGADYLVLGRSLTQVSEEKLISRLEFLSTSVKPEKS